MSKEKLQTAPLLLQNLDADGCQPGKWKTGQTGFEDRHEAGSELIVQYLTYHTKDWSCWKIRCAPV